MLEAEDIFLRKACFEDWEAMYRNVWSRPEAARFMVWQVTKGEEVLCGKEFFYHTRPDNAASKALALSCGFVYRRSEWKRNPKTGKEYELEVYSKRLAFFP